MNNVYTISFPVKKKDEKWEKQTEAISTFVLEGCDDSLNKPHHLISDCRKAN